MTSRSLDARPRSQLRCCVGRVAAIAEDCGCVSLPFTIRAAVPVVVGCAALARRMSALLFSVAHVELLLLLIEREIRACRVDRGKALRPSAAALQLPNAVGAFLAGEECVIGVVILPFAVSSLEDNVLFRHPFGDN